MQSPTGVLFRTLVTLACLVAIPMAALFSSSLPGVMTAILEGRWPLGAGGGRHQNGTPESTPCGVSGGLTANPAEPVNPLWQTYPPKQPNIPGSTLGLPPAIAPAAYQAAVGLPGVTTEVKSAVATTLADPMASETAASNVATPAAPGPGLDMLPPSVVVGAASPHIYYFTQIQQRLRQLGATYYLLETWGNQRELYRFYCEVPIGGSPNFVRHFEATHAEPLQAMTQVLHEVESHQIARH